MWCVARFGIICTILKNLKPATLLKVTLLHGYFSRFLNCTNGTKSRNASHLWGNHRKLPLDFVQPSKKRSMEGLIFRKQHFSPNNISDNEMAASDSLLKTSSCLNSAWKKCRHILYGRSPTVSFVYSEQALL